MQIVSVRQASPAQMQQVAKKIKLGDSVNQVAGLYQAIFCSNPSPMQIQILTKGLKAVGVNYIKVTEKCEPATSADRTPELKQALSAMAQRAQMYSSLCPDPLGIGAIMVAGNQLYVSIDAFNSAEADRCARFVISGKLFKKLPFQEAGSTVYQKTIRQGRTSYTASVTCYKYKVTLLVYKGI
jgi:hypothetical protein